MADTDENGIGTQDLEKGLRSSPASTFRTIAINAVVLLLVFNSAGLVRWTQALPSNPATAWLAERAADWHRLMQIPPADVYESVKKVLKVE
jgi:hypothetical protein